MLRFCVSEDDVDDELVEEHVTKVCKRFTGCLTDECHMVH